MTQLQTSITKRNCTKPNGSNVLTNDAILITKQLQTFQRSFLPPSSEYKQQSTDRAHSTEPSKLFTDQHSIIVHDILIPSNTTVRTLYHMLQQSSKKLKKYTRNEMGTLSMFTTGICKMHRKNQECITNSDWKISRNDTNQETQVQVGG